MDSGERLDTVKMALKLGRNVTDKTREDACEQAIDRAHQDLENARQQLTEAKADLECCQERAVVVEEKLGRCQTQFTEAEAKLEYCETQSAETYAELKRCRGQSVRRAVWGSVLGLAFVAVIVGVRTGLLPWLVPEPPDFCSGATVTGLALISADGDISSVVPAGGVFEGAKLDHTLRPQTDLVSVEAGEAGCLFRWVLLTYHFQLEFRGTELALNRWNLTGVKVEDTLELTVYPIDQAGNVSDTPAQFTYDMRSP